MQPAPATRLARVLLHAADPSSCRQTASQLAQRVTASMLAPGEVAPKPPPGEVIQSRTRPRAAVLSMPCSQLLQIVPTCAGLAASFLAHPAGTAMFHALIMGCPQQTSLSCKTRSSTR